MITTVAKQRLVYANQRFVRSRGKNDGNGMKARVADALRQQSVKQLDLKKNLESLRATIDIALAIDEQLKSEIERAGALRKQIIAERGQRNQTPARPPHRFVP